MSVGVLLFLILIALYFLYKKLDKLVSLLGKESDVNTDADFNQGKTVKDLLITLNKNINFLTKKLTFVADHFQADNPAGEKSAEHRKRENLAKIYASFLQETKGLSEKQAKIRANFEVYEIYGYDEDELINEINSGFLFDSVRKKYAEKAEENYYKSGILENDIKEYLNEEGRGKGKIKILPHDLFAPLYEVIVKQEYEKGKKLRIDTSEETESVTSYRDFVEHRAIIQNLLEIGILDRVDVGRDWFNPKFKIKVTDLAELRKIIYEGETSHDDKHFEDMYEEGKLHSLFSRLFID